MRTFRCSSSGIRRSDIWLGEVIQEAPVRWPGAPHRAPPGRAVIAITSPFGPGRPEDRFSVDYALTSSGTGDYGLPTGVARDNIGTASGRSARRGLQNAEIHGLLARQPQCRIAAPAWGGGLRRVIASRPWRRSNPGRSRRPFGPRDDFWTWPLLELAPCLTGLDCPRAVGLGHPRAEQRARKAEGQPGGTGRRPTLPGARGKRDADGLQGIEPAIVAADKPRDPRA